MEKRAVNLILRYALSLAASVNSLWIFYFIFSPLTIYLSFFVLQILFSVSLSGNTIFFSNFSITLAKACIAGSAYYLLFVLNLATPMPPRKRIFSLIFSFTLFLIVNIARIAVFSIILAESFSLFDTIHLIVWYFLSGIVVFLIWILEIRIFKIKEIPVYSDIKFLIGKIKAR